MATMTEPARTIGPASIDRETGARLASVDLLRGVVMVVMALDHTRDYLGDLVTNPTDLSRASTALFLTRWITHFCAPTFFLLAGTGARLSLARRGREGVSRFLLTRGLWLVVLELTVLRWAWQFNVDYRVTVLNVIWALGWSMVALSLLVRLPDRAVATIAVLMIATHDALDGVAPERFGALAPLWHVLHRPGVLPSPEGTTLFLAYPLVPWIGVMAAGWALGAVYAWPAERRRRWLLAAGACLVLGFVLLRALNAYGDPRPWSVQPTGARTLLSFVNTSKYPPSLLFLLMTLGPALLVLRALESRIPSWLRPATTFGRVPFFYYFAHVVVIHLVAVAICVARYGTAAPMLASPTLDRFPVTQPPGWPLPLPAIYLLWACVVVVLYPACRRFAAWKAQRRDRWWVGYL